MLLTQIEEEFLDEIDKLQEKRMIKFWDIDNVTYGVLRGGGQIGVIELRGNNFKFKPIEIITLNAHDLRQVADKLDELNGEIV